MLLLRERVRKCCRSTESCCTTTSGRDRAPENCIRPVRSTERTQAYAHEQEQSVCADRADICRALRPPSGPLFSTAATGDARSLEVAPCKDDESPPLTHKGRTSFFFECIPSPAPPDVMSLKDEIARAVSAAVTYDPKQPNLQRDAYSYLEQLKGQHAGESTVWQSCLEIFLAGEGGSSGSSAWRYSYQPEARMFGLQVVDEMLESR